MEQDKQMIISSARKPSVETGVVKRREMIKIPAVMDALGPVERAVFLASTAKIIAEYSPTELAAELGTALKWICKDVGYRTTDESDRQYLVIRVAEILKRYYANLTLKDFRMAFEMSITGELDDFLPRGRDGQPDKNHYQQFNAEYVCKILNAYKGRRGWIFKKANEAMPKVEPKPDPESQERYLNETRHNVIRSFEEYKATGVFPELSPIAELLYYGVLSDAGLAPEIVITPDEQKSVLYRTIYDMAQRGYIGNARRLEKIGPDAPELKHDAFILARQKALKVAFAKMVADGINITDYIKIECTE